MGGEFSRQATVTTQSLNLTETAYDFCIYCHKFSFVNGTIRKSCAIYKEITTDPKIAGIYFIFCKVRISTATVVALAAAEVIFAAASRIAINL